MGGSLIFEVLKDREPEVINQTQEPHNIGMCTLPGKGTHT